MSSLGVLSNECSTFLEMMNDIGIDKTQQHYIIKKMISLAIRATYFIFCRRNKTWDSPDLIKLYFFLFICKYSIQVYHSISSSQLLIAYT